MVRSREAGRSHGTRERAPLGARRRRGYAAVASLVVGLLASTAGVAVATSQDPRAVQPLAGNAGDVKLHDVTDSVNDNSDNPKPCDPVLVSFNFDVGAQYTYRFLTQPGGVVLIGPTTVTVSADPQQEPSSGDFRPPLVDGGQYKLQWDFGTSITTGSKQKVFKINCGAPPEESGSFQVTKTVSGAAAPVDWSFDVHITCSDGFESDVVLTDEAPSATVTDLDVGTTCTVTEPDSQGATTTYSPAQTSDPIEDGTTTTITIDNAFGVEVGGVVVGDNLTVRFTG